MIPSDEHGLRLKKAMADLPDYVGFSYAGQKDSDVWDAASGVPLPEKITVAISFCKPNYGFGEITFIQKDDTIYVDSEFMGRDLVLKFLQTLLDSAIFDTDEDPIKRQKYEQARRIL